MDNENDRQSPNMPTLHLAFLRNVILKALALFVIINLAFLWADPISDLGRLSAYNVIFPGRVRLPFGEDFERSYNISILQLNAMLASHELSDGAKPADEYRVLLVGDSSVWGFLLGPDETVSAQLNKLDLVAVDGRRVRAYNLGYPTMSATKDLLFLDKGLSYDPDLILWFVTLESLPFNKQLTSPVLQHNPIAVRDLIERNKLSIDPEDEAFIKPSFWDQTLVGQRRELADLLRLQFFGLMWAATQIDHHVPDELDRPQDDQPAERAFQEYEGDLMPEETLAIEIFEAGIRMAGEVPLVLVNEPIFIARGENSEIRYNSFYPRWAYDQYREMMVDQAMLKGWNYVDLWNEVPSDEFTDSAIHYSTVGVARVVDRVREALDEVWAILADGN